MPLGLAPGGYAVASVSMSLESGPLCCTRLSHAAASTTLYSGGVAPSLPESSRTRLAAMLPDHPGLPVADAVSCVPATGCALLSASRADARFVFWACDAFGSA